MDQEIFDWLLLLGRWVHITTAITWIGTSIFFMWLDRSFEFNADSKRPGHVGELWMVHGGGFYHVEKLQMGPTKVPEHLHWFKWESYWTWFSGLFLLFTIFYTGNGTFLLDSSVSNITYWQAVGIGLASIAVSWIFYDLLWESRLVKTQPLTGHALTLLWFAGVSYFLCNTLSGRAAYIHVGAMLGTWMTANVFLRIIPRQVKMVEASQRGEAVNQDWGKNAKNRSTHNTYFTLPVIFIMLSNHFPSTYGNNWSWLILLAVSAAGAAIRHFFLIRLSKPELAKAFAGVGIGILVCVMLLTRENDPSPIRHSHALHADSGTDAAATALSDSAVSGSVVSGIVRFDGSPPRMDRLILPPGCNPKDGSPVFSNEVLVENGRLRNVLLVVTKGLEGKTFPPPPQKPVVIDQKYCIYEPRVSAVRAGQPVEFLNSDPIFHNVKAVSKNNDEFNLAMPNKDDRIVRVFMNREISLQTRCSVHPWMSANIAVVEHPYFAVTGANGAFQIKGLPPGDYSLEAWHEVFGTQTQDFKITDQENTELEFVFKN